MDENEILYNLIKDAAKIQLSVEKIKQKLPGNPEQDRQMIFLEIQKCNNEENSEILIKLLRELFDECFTYEELQQFSFITRKTDFINEFLAEISKLMQIGKLKEALVKLDEFIYSIPFLFKETDFVEYHNFNSYIEEKLFLKEFNPEKEVMPIPNNQQYSALYYIYGALLFQFQRYGESGYFLDLASSINPVAPTIYFEKAEIYKLQGNFEEFYKLTNKALKYSTTSEFLARGYRNLGFYYIEQEDFELATALYNFSLKYESNDMAYSELNYIKSLGFTSQVDYNFGNLLTHYNIQIGPSDLVLETLIELIEEKQNEKNIPEVISLYNILYDLTKDEEIKKIINDIKLS